jgi:hypothetical protein
MHEIMDKKFYLGPKFGTLFNKKWITISELLQSVTRLGRDFVPQRGPPVCHPAGPGLHPMARPPVRQANLLL